MISGCLAQAVHDRLAELVFGKALGENAVNLSGIEIKTAGSAENTMTIPSRVNDEWRTNGR